MTFFECLIRGLLLYPLVYLVVAWLLTIAGIPSSPFNL